MKKTKLIIFHPYSSLGGADKNLYRLINNLNLKKFSITFISLNKSVLKKQLSKKINFINLKASRTLYVIFELRKILNKHIEEQYNYEKIILLSNQNFANVLCPIILFGNKQFKSILIERNHLDEFKHSNNLTEYVKKIFLRHAN